MNGKLRVAALASISFLTACGGDSGGSAPATDAGGGASGSDIGAPGGSGGTGGAGGAGSPDAASRDALAPTPDGATPADAAPPADALMPADTPSPGDTAPPADTAPPGPDTAYEHDPARLDLHGPCPAASRFGRFKVEANETEGYTAIDGVVKDGVAPGINPDEAGVEGDCKLLRARRLVCNPTCEPGFTCDVGGVCVPMPVGQDMGQVVFRGLVQPVALDPLQPGNTYFFTRLPHPGFTPGEVVQLTNTPGYLGPLELYGVGVEPIVPVEPTWVLEESAPLSLHWAAPAIDTRSRVFLEMDIDQHGLTPITLTCDLPDTGEATLPAAATDALIAAGVTGFPFGRLTRRTADSFTDAARCVDFLVTSVRPVAVEVTGHVPCTRDEDCPPDLVCDLLIQQCH